MTHFQARRPPDAPEGHPTVNDAQPAPQTGRVAIPWATHSLSVFVAAYNEVGNLAPTVETIMRALSVSVEDYEIIIVDDGSTDGTYEVAEDLAARYAEVRVHPQPAQHGAGLRLDARRRGGHQRLVRLRAGRQHLAVSVAARAVRQPRQGRRHHLVHHEPRDPRAGSAHPLVGLHGRPERDVRAQHALLPRPDDLPDRSSCGPTRSRPTASRRWPRRCCGRSTRGSPSSRSPARSRSAPPAARRR